MHDILIVLLLLGLVTITASPRHRHHHQNRHAKYRRSAAGDEDEEEEKNGDAVKYPPCDEDTLMTYLAELQAIDPESVVNLATVEDVDNLCHRVTVTLDAVDTYLQTCEPPGHKDLYVQLIKGVKSLHDKLCVQADFKKRFKKYIKCFHQLHDEFQQCEGPPDWAENTDIKKVCAAYKEIVDCYYIKTAKLCGVEAAHTIKTLMAAVINTIIMIKCPEIKSNPPVPDAMPMEVMLAGANQIQYVCWVFGLCFVWPICF